MTRAPVDQAAAMARAAAGEAGVEVVLVDDEPTARCASEVLALVWQSRADELVSAEMAWVLAYSGNYVAIAKNPTGEVVGACMGLRGADAEGLLLHSHVTGVVPAMRGRAVGFALKLHQRAWALDRGLRRVVWTFDPLLARNAYFNVSVLGAVITAYHRDFYGDLPDGVNRGDHTDRCVVRWDIASDRVRDAIDARAPARIYGSASNRFALTRHKAGRPVVIPTRGAPRVVELPPDILELRAQRPELAREWRLALRAVLEQAFADGLAVSTVTPDGDYVLDRPAADE